MTNDVDPTSKHFTESVLVNSLNRSPYKDSTEDLDSGDDFKVITFSTVNVWGSDLISPITVKSVRSPRSMRERMTHSHVSQDFLLITIDHPYFCC